MSSSNTRWSFRARAKDKINKIVESNLTASIRDKIPTDNIKEKTRNYTDVIKQQIHYDDLKNKTKNYVDRILPSNRTFGDDSQGFFDSLFDPQTTMDTYFKTAIICLWFIAIISMIFTIVTMLLPLGKNASGTRRVKLIFLHTFLCEFCYLIYILLSWINVSLDHQLNKFLCDIAEYGMYATVPIMCFSLLILSLERLLNRFRSTSVTNRCLTNSLFIQILLITIWIVSITIISFIVSWKNKLKNPLKRIFSMNYQCSIDGQLVPYFKILFLILFIVLIVLIIKSMVVTFVSSIFTPSCFQKNEDKKKKSSKGSHMSLIFVIFLFLNLFISSPFYIVSTGSSISKLFQKQQEFSMNLKVTFVLRLLSIIFQCWIFCIFDNDIWLLLDRCISLITTKKMNSTDKVPNRRHRSYSTENGIELRSFTKKHEEDDDDDLSDEVFAPPTKQPKVSNVTTTITEKKPKQSKTKSKKPSKKQATPEESSSSSSDDEPDKKQTPPKKPFGSDSSTKAVQPKKSSQKQTPPEESVESDSNTEEEQPKKLPQKQTPPDESVESDSSTEEKQPKKSPKKQTSPKKLIQSDSDTNDEAEQLVIPEKPKQPSKPSEQKTNNHHQKTSKDRKPSRRKRIYSNDDEV